MKDNYNNALKTSNRELAESALVLACKGVDKEPKEIAKVLNIDYKANDDGIDKQ